MNIHIADNSGFCFGVERAVSRAYMEVQKNGKIYTLGPLIHNPQVINELREKGVQIIENISNCHCNDKIIIRTHGVPKDIYDSLEEKNVNIIDMTCPYVKRVQHIVNKYYKDGYTIIIIGDKNHPEINSVNGWANNSSIILETLDDAKQIDYIEKACIVAQTTLTEEIFSKIVDILTPKINNVKIINTICNATKERQKSAYVLSQNVDLMLVIGGYNSSNTKKLYEICKENCDNTFLIESELDLPDIDYSKLSNIGITAGASTPDWIIHNVVKAINDIVLNSNMQITKEK